jgi:hypothetical protein
MPENTTKSDADVVRHMAPPICMHPCCGACCNACRGRDCGSCCLAQTKTAATRQQTSGATLRATGPRSGATRR